jgi:hypothetical protein
MSYGEVLFGWNVAFVVDIKGNLWRIYYLKRGVD